MTARTAGETQQPIAGRAFFAAGIALAAAVALTIRAVPPAFLQPGSAALAGVFAAIAASGFASVWLIGRVGGLRGPRLERSVHAALAGALAFDGLMIGFAPGLYGHAGTELTAAAAGLLWGVCCFGLAAAWLARRMG